MALALLLAGALYLGWQAGTDASRDAAELARSESIENEGTPLRDASSAVERHAEAAAAAAPPDATPVAEAATLVVITGRVLGSEGQALRDAKISLSGWESNNEAVTRHGLPKAWTNPQASCDVEARFVVRFDPPGAYQFALHVEAEGYVRRSWRWHTLARGAQIDLGNIALVRGGRIYGRIVDAQGAAIPGFRSVSISQLGVERGAAGEPFYSSTPIAVGSADFEVPGLPAGKFRVAAEWGHYVWSKPSEIELALGEAEQVDLVYDGPSLARRIVITPYCPRDPTLAWKLAEVVLHGAPDGPRTLRHPHGTGQVFFFDDLPPGTYRVATNDPRFVPAERGGLEPGHGYRLDVEGNSSLEVQVVDAVSGAPIEPYRLLLREKAENSSHDTRVIRELGDPLPPGGVYGGLLSGAWVVEAQAEGYGSARAELEPCAPNERKVAALRLAKPASLEVQVLDANGAPQADVALMLWPEFPPDPQQTLAPEYQRQQSRGNQRNTLREARTDAQGVHRFSEIGAGHYELEAWKNADAMIRVAPIEVAPGANQTVEARLPPTGSLLVRLTGHERLPMKDAMLFVEPALTLDDPELGLRQMHRMTKPWSVPDRITTAADAQRGARFESLRPGRWLVVLTAREHGKDEPPGAIHSRAILGTVDVTASQRTEASFDLAAWIPGRILVRVFSQGRPVEGAQVFLYPVEPEPHPRTSAGMGIKTDAQGEAASDGLFPGTWQVDAMAFGGRWQVHPRRELILEPGGSQSLELDAVIIPGAMLVLDAETSAPLVTRRIQVFSPGGETELLTDERGLATAELAPGTYIVRDVASQQALPREPAAEIAWPPAEGTSVKVRVAR